MKKEILKQWISQRSNDKKKTIELSLSRGSKLGLLLCYIDIAITFIFAITIVGIITL